MKNCKECKSYIADKELYIGKCKTTGRTIMMNRGTRELNSMTEGIMMELDEAIKHCFEVAEQNECKMTSDDGYTDVSMKRCAADHRQLAEWLTELKQWRRVYGVCPSYEMCIPECKEGYNAQIAEYKRLLKAAVEDFRFLESHSEDEEGNCLINYQGVKVDCKICPLNNNGKCDPKIGCRWNYEVEALKLIGEEGGNDEKNI